MSFVFRLARLRIGERGTGKEQVATLEKNLIDQAMQASRYRQPQAAELLGLTYNQLRAMLRKHGLVERYGRGKGVKP